MGSEQDADRLLDGISEFRHDDEPTLGGVRSSSQTVAMQPMGRSTPIVSP